MCVAHKASLLLIQEALSLFLRNFCETDNRVGRSLQLVTHAGQKFTLETVGFFDCAITGLKFLIRFTDLFPENFSLGDIPNYGHHAKIAFGPYRTEANLDRKLRTTSA